MRDFSSKDKKALIKTIAGLTVNLSAVWFGAVFITPNFSPEITAKAIVALTYDIVFGILFLWLCFKSERSLL